MTPVAFLEEIDALIARARPEIGASAAERNLWLENATDLIGAKRRIQQRLNSYGSSVQPIEGK